MASDERNALAELAEFLKGESECDSAGFKAKVIEKFGEAAWNRHIERKRKFGRASRIIAELDDVFRTYSFDPYGHSFLLLADRAVKKCRLIAEEGVNNGN